MSQPDQKKDETKPGDLVMKSIKHPTIKNISAGDLRQWTIARTEYLVALKTECGLMKKDWKQYVVAVKDSFEPPGYYDFVRNIAWDLPDNASEHDLIEKIKECIGETRIEDRNTYDNALQGVQLDYKEEDAKGRAMKFIWEIQQIITKHGFKKHETIAFQKKQMMRAIISKIHPEELKLSN